MDMTRHLTKWLNDDALRLFGDCYEGVIDNVVEQWIRNRFTAERELQPVIRFDDGWSLIPNVSQRRALVAMWGAESDEWRGRRLQVYRHRKERVDETTGAVKVTYEKRVRQPVSEFERAG
jgi:hypothetical protein